MRVIIQSKGTARRIALLNEADVPLCVSVWSKSGDPSVLTLPSGECYCVFPFNTKFPIPKHMLGELLVISPRKALSSANVRAIK